MAAAHLPAALLLLTVLVASATADLTCPYGRELSYCHSGCPPNCTTYSTPISSCPETCIPGCFCPADLVEFDEDLCVDSSQCSLLEELDAEIPDMDQCSQYGTCEECITSNPACQWCPYLPDETSVKGNRCRDRKLNPLCPETINDPRSSMEVAEDIDFDDNVQIRPQKLKLKLRVGEPVQFPLQFRLSENYPLDVYFLLDVTGSFARSFRNTVIPLATDLVQALSNISSNYRAGFGSFGEKRAFPYALASGSPDAYHINAVSGAQCTNARLSVADCNPTISFRHTNTLERVETEELESILGNISIHLNIDSLEGGLDGLLQVLTCEDIIGWRNASLRMLLYMSNANFHLAGDGKVGAAFRPNPGECHLEPGEENGTMFYEYTKDTFYDYPSVYQVRNLIRSSQTNVVFAVTTQFKPTYELLQSELGLGSSVQLTELLSNSSNIISVIRSSYDDISQEVRVSPDRDFPQLNFNFQSGVNCNATSDSQGCTGVRPGDTVSLNVTVNLTSCMNDAVVLLQSSVFGEVALEIETLCQCPCTSEPVQNHTVCNGTGTLVCGLCECNEGMSGDQCQCEGDETPVCGPSEDNQCSGRGRGVCDCGECQCFVQEKLLRTRNISKPYFGDYCECDDLESCGGISEDGELCLGRGTCDCQTDKCICTEMAPRSGLLYYGDMCECDPDLCHNDMFPGRQCVSTATPDNEDLDGTCGCEGCLCSEGAQAVDGTCQPLPDECVVNEECARCEKNLQSSGTDCDQLREEGCVTILYTNGSFPSSHLVECSFEDGDGCTHTFFLSSTVDTILVDDDRECPSDDGGLTPLAWIIPVSVIGGLLLLGALILLIVLLVIWILDRLEYKRFKDDLQETNWNPQENPMYVSPQQEYSNVAYKKARRRQ